MPGLDLTKGVTIKRIDTDRDKCNLKVVYEGGRNQYYSLNTVDGGEAHISLVEGAAYPFQVGKQKEFEQEDESEFDGMYEKVFSFHIGYCNGESMCLEVQISTSYREDYPYWERTGNETNASSFIRRLEWGILTDVS